MISILLLLLFIFSALSVPVCEGVISGLYLFGIKVFPGLFISFILTGMLVRILEYKGTKSIVILVLAGTMEHIYVRGTKKIIRTAGLRTGWQV